MKQTMSQINKYIPLLLLVLAACAGPKSAPQEPMAMDFLPQRGEFVTVDGSRAAPEVVLALARTADYLLLGEGHRNECDHAVQQLLVRKLAEGGRLPAVGLEMVGADLQPVLDRFNNGELAPEAMEKELGWQENWGYPFALFEPLFRIAREHGLPLGALNAPRALVKKVSEKGLEALAPEERAQLPRIIVPPLGEQREELQAIQAMHAEKGQGSGELERFVLVQSLWDTAMAEHAVDLRRRTGRPVVVVAGAGHVERGWGIASRLRGQDPSARIVLLVPLRDSLDFDRRDGDGFFYCPDTFQSRMGMTLEAREGSVVVDAVQRESRADRAGLRPGDVLVRAQGLAVHSFQDLHLAGKRAHDEQKSLVFVLLRRGERIAVDLGPLGKSPASTKE
ncbi:MAG: ChaN family lipoprotein [Desulfovibrio sp.]